jgi:hypothetical protein
VLVLSVGAIGEPVSRAFDGGHAEVLRDPLAGADEVRLLDLFGAD